MTPWMRKIHKWVGLIIGIQLLLWMASGLVMSVMDANTVRGREFRVQPPPKPWPAGTLPAQAVLAKASEPVEALSTGWLRDRPVYRLAIGKGTRLADAFSGEAVEVDAKLAERLAAASYAGSGRPTVPERIEPTLETRGHAGPIWRVDFADAEDTTVYLSGQTGDVLEHRNRSWRLFDLFWMLHIMDYTGRKDFNNPLVVGTAIGGLWLALTGLWLLLTSLRLNEFIPRRWRATRELTVCGPDGDTLRTVHAPAGDTVYLALARNGLQLPSNCGGGQSCGLCEVRCKGQAPAPTNADRAHLPAGKLKSGYRLACNLAVDTDLQVEVVGGAGLWTEHEAVVEGVTAVTPFLREIVLKPDTPPGADYQPGAYIQIHVPDYSAARDDILHVHQHQADWERLDLPESFSNKDALRRSYSLSCPTEQTNGRLTLLVRYSPGQQGRKRPQPGKGSGYLYTRKPGDRIRFSGPFGDFALKPGGREKIFIGGGAGMAPLRAMIRASLASGAQEQMHFWYGARTLRDAPYVQEMSALARKHANFSWHLVLSEDAEHGAGLLKGLVHEAAHDVLLQAHPDLHACDFYLCGPPAMLAATQKLLQRLGVAEERIAFDDFKV